jgi:membrane-associated phospholipid phosphatase
MKLPSAARTELRLVDPADWPRSDGVGGIRLRRQLTLALGLLCLLPIVPFADQPVAAWFNGDHLPGDLGKAIHLSEMFAHGVGVMLVLLGLGFLVPASRWYLPRVAAMAYGAGACTTLVKMFVTRPRPHQLLNHVVGSETPWQWHFDWTLQRLTVDDASLRSFPSGHAATAVGLAIGLALLFPRGRYLFWGIAFMASIQRLQAFAHFTSDVIAGWIIGLSWSALCLHPRALGALFSRFEPRPQTWSNGGLATGETDDRTAPPRAA